MKILVLNGSPKRDRSDTMHITGAFLEGMRDAAPQEIKTIHVIDSRIEYCAGCFACKRNGGVCIYDDDMKGIIGDILASDLVVFSFGLYCYGMPAPLKALVDRLMPLSTMEMRRVNDRYEHVGQMDFSHLRFMMICGCGYPNSKHNFEPEVGAFRLKFGRDSTVITVPESPMFGEAEAEAVTKPRLALVRQAGRQYAETGAIDEPMMAQITSPMIPEETYAAIVNQRG